MIKSSHTWRTWKVIEETNDTVTIVFETGQPFVYEPGQFINISLPVNGEKVTRSYSLSSTPSDTHPAVTIKRVSGGKMSNYIVDNAHKIMQWETEGPYGSFVPSDITFQCRQVVLLGGGSGITPLFAIARSVLERSSNTTVNLIYAVRTPDDIIFKSAIETWQQQYSNRFNVWYAVSQPQAAGLPANESFIKGRLNTLIVKKLIRRSVGDPSTGVHYFMCGPVELMKMHRDVLSSLAVPDDQVFMELFKGDEANNIELPNNEQEVLLHFYEQSNLLEVKPGQSILAAALEDRIPLPYSCKTGTCGKCVAKLTAGKITMANNYALRKSDVDNGLILLCQSYPVNSEVTVEIG